jgi:hypothetical protein
MLFALRGTGFYSPVLAMGHGRRKLSEALTGFYSPENYCGSRVFTPHRHGVLFPESRVFIPQPFYEDINNIKKIHASIRLNYCNNLYNSNDCRSRKMMACG